MTNEEAINHLGTYKFRGLNHTTAEFIPPPGEWQEAMEMAISALREQCVRDVTKTSGWISVEERLPGSEKILITNGEFVKEGYRRPDGVWKYGTEEHMKWERLSCHPVTHWMPLPEPPKETT